MKLNMHRFLVVMRSMLIIAVPVCFESNQLPKNQSIMNRHGNYDAKYKFQVVVGFAHFAQFHWQLFMIHVRMECIDSIECIVQRLASVSETHLRSWFAGCDRSHQRKSIPTQKVEEKQPKLRELFDILRGWSNQNQKIVFH